MDKIAGLPAHPLLVHIPVVLVPLAAIGALAIAVWPKLRARIGWVVATLAVLGGFGAILASGAGESLQEGRPGSAVLRHHAELGETARNFSILFAMIIVGYLALEWLLARRASTGDVPQHRLMKWILPAAAVATVASGAWATYTIMDAGHTGAQATWQNGTHLNDGTNFAPNSGGGGDD